MLDDKDFVDKKIINFIMIDNKANKIDEENQDIKLGYAFINESKFDFERTEVLKKNISLLLPVEFTKIEDEDFKIKDLYSNHDDTVQIFFCANVF